MENKLQVKLKDYWPIGARVLVEPERMTTTAGGLHIPEQSQKLSRWVRVLKVGVLVETVKPGDIVLMESVNTVQKLNVAGDDGEERELMQVFEQSLAGVYREGLSEEMQTPKK